MPENVQDILFETSNHQHTFKTNSSRHGPQIFQLQQRLVPEPSHPHISKWTLSSHHPLISSTLGRSLYTHPGSPQSPAVLGLCSPKTDLTRTPRMVPTFVQRTQGPSLVIHWSSGLKSNSSFRSSVGKRTRAEQAIFARQAFRCASRGICRKPVCPWCFGELKLTSRTSIFKKVSLQSTSRRIEHGCWPVSSRP